jgi:hypothetical protein
MRVYTSFAMDVPRPRNYFDEKLFIANAKTFRVRSWHDLMAVGLSRVYRSRRNETVGATMIIDYEFNTMGQLPSAGVIEAAIIAEQNGIEQTADRDCGKND